MDYVTVSVESMPIRSLTEKHLEDFSEAAWETPGLAGPACGANLATGTLSMIAAVDVPDVARGTEIAVAAFRQALAQAGIEAGISEAFAQVGPPGRDELLDGPGVAKRLGVTRQRVYQLTDDAGARFPRPVASFGGSHVWRWGDIADWIAVGGRRKAGRPRRIA